MQAYFTGVLGIVDVARDNKLIFASAYTIAYFVSPHANGRLCTLHGHFDKVIGHAHIAKDSK
jgi:hypothetical protein